VRRRTRTGAAAYVEGLVTRLGDCVRAAIETWDVEAVHDARVASRRLKAALDLLSPVIPPSALCDLSRGARRLRRAFGPLRDADVMLDHLRSARVPEALAPAVAWVARQIQDQRETLRKECLADIGCKGVRRMRLIWWEVTEDVRDLDRRAAALVAGALPRVWEEFSIAAGMLAAQPPQADDSGDRATSAAAPDPHAVRIAGKHIRYTLELASTAGFAVRPAVLRMFKKMQDELGLWHDFAVLSQRTIELAVANQLVLHDPTLYATTLRLAERFVAAAQTRLRRFVARWTRYCRQIGDAVRQIAGESASRRSQIVPTAAIKEDSHVPQALPDAPRRSSPGKPRSGTPADAGGPPTGPGDGEPAATDGHPAGGDLA